MINASDYRGAQTRVLIYIYSGQFIKLFVNVYVNNQMTHIAYSIEINREHYAGYIAFCWLVFYLLNMRFLLLSNGFFSMWP